MVSIRKFSFGLTVATLIGLSMACGGDSGSKGSSPSIVEVSTVQVTPTQVVPTVTPVSTACKILDALPKSVLTSDMLKIVPFGPDVPVAALRLPGIYAGFSGQEQDPGARTNQTVFIIRSVNNPASVDLTYIYLGAVQQGKWTLTSDGTLHSGFITKLSDGKIQQVVFALSIRPDGRLHEERTLSQNGVLLFTTYADLDRCQVSIK